MPTDDNDKANLGSEATVGSLGNLAAGGIAGILWTATNPTEAFAYLATWMLTALVGLGLAARRHSTPTAP